MFQSEDQVVKPIHSSSLPLKPSHLSLNIYSSLLRFDVCPMEPQRLYRRLTFRVRMSNLASYLLFAQQLLGVKDTAICVKRPSALEGGEVITGPV